jgi:uncharacterized RDD family membrane protein YckC
MRKADLTTRAVAGFVDLLIVIGLARLPDVIGYLAAIGYILVRDGLFEQQSVGKKVIGIRVLPSDGSPAAVTIRESIIRNMPLAAAFLLFRIPYAGWVLGPLVLGVEGMAALGDERGMRIGDMLARTLTVQPETAGIPAPGAEQVPSSAGVTAPPADEPGTAGHGDGPQGA